tara:strand:- start:435 stop:650 length:216 start_codon:yes stop_codon:yes gene_type:complete
MSLSTETSNLTLAYINTTNNISQLENNIRDTNNNVQKINNIVDDLFNKLQIDENSIMNYKALLMDISNNIS